MDEHESLLSKAKIQLMQRTNSVFYQTILFSLKTSWNTNTETAATDGKNLFINPEWFTSLSNKERIGLLVHEVMHVALNHMCRRGNRIPLLWNIAADHVINLNLTEAGYELPEHGLYDISYEGMSTEQVYKLLDKDASGGISVPGGLDIIYPPDATEAEITNRAVTNLVIKAAIQARSTGYGNIPGEVLLQLDTLINPKLPWDVLLQNYMSTFAKDDYTWSRPNKRYLPDYYLPTAYSERVCNIAIAVDSSGSVLPEEFSFFTREITSIHSSLKPDLITLITFDTEIHSVYELYEDVDAMTELEFTGGGGTDIAPILEWAKQNDPEVMIVFTDGDFYQPDDMEQWPTCSILWLIHNNKYFTAPVGEVIHYDL